MLPAGRAADSNRVVRVAYPLQAGITAMDENGNYCGYLYEYLEEIAQYTGWTYEFVQVPGDINESLLTLMEMVRTGEVDLMGMMLYNDHTADTFDFSSHSFGAAETVLQIPQDTPLNFVFSARTNQPLRVAIRSTIGRQITALEEYCKMNLFQLEYVECEGIEGQIQAVQEGRADVLLNTSFNNIGPVRTVAHFSPNPIYFVTGKGRNEALLADLNTAMLAIDQIDPLFVSGLYNKYFTPSDDQMSLRPKEIEYLERVGTIRVGYLTYLPPFQYTDGEGQPRGIGIDLLKLFAQRLPVEFEFLPADSFEELQALMDEGQIHMVANMPYNYALARATNLSMTRPYVSSQYVLVTSGLSGEDLEGKTMAYIKGSPNIADARGPSKVYPSSWECIQAVAKGNADYTYVDAYTAHYYLNLPQYRNLRLSAQTDNPRNSCFGVTPLGQATLLAILNKAILTTDLTQIQSIATLNTLSTQEHSFTAMVMEYPVESVLFIAGSLLFIILILLYILGQRDRSSRRTALELKKHYQVYAMTNEYFFEYDLRNRSLLVPPFSSAEGEERSEPLHFTASNLDGEVAQTRYHAFIDFISTREDGIHEEYLECGNGEFHWLRIALVTVSDREQPAYILGKINIIDDERQEKEALLKLASTDSLTHLYNAETMRSLVTEAIADLQPGQYGGMILMDVDFFKSINDTYGHLEGDATLVHMAELLRSCFREEDILARPGGDEFLVFLRSIRDEAHLAKRCGQFCEVVGHAQPGQHPAVTISVGAVLALPGDTFDQAYRLADEAMYNVKRDGRNNYSVAKR